VSNLPELFFFILHGNGFTVEKQFLEITKAKKFVTGVWLLRRTQ